MVVASAVFYRHKGLCKSQHATACYVHNETLWWEQYPQLVAGLNRFMISCKQSMLCAAVSLSLMLFSINYLVICLNFDLVDVGHLCICLHLAWLWMGVTLKPQGVVHPCYWDSTVVTPMLKDAHTYSSSSNWCCITDYHQCKLLGEGWQIFRTTCLPCFNVVLSLSLCVSRPIHKGVRANSLLTFTTYLSS